MSPPVDHDIPLRILNVGAGLGACVMVLLAVYVLKPGRAEAIGMTGGALTCGAVAVGSLGVILGWPGFLFLPFVTASLLYTIAGRAAQLWRIRHPKTKGGEPKVTSDEQRIQEHLDRQAGVPDGFVRLDDGRVRPVGGTNDNVSPRPGDPDYLPDPA